MAPGRPMIAGFVIAGEGERTLLIRAIGAALTRFGVGGALADPKLLLFDSESRLLLETDNWPTLSTFSPVEAVATRVGAFELSRQGEERDAALYVRLPAGNYTAHVASANGSSGIALVEVYDVVDP
ncbi:MAG: hypothetical protein ABIR80_02500 [Opitutaceae bacterium]